MTISVEPLGVISRFNGVDVNQSRDYIKISNKTYINKITENKSTPIDAATVGRIAGTSLDIFQVNKSRVVIKTTAINA